MSFRFIAREFPKIEAEEQALLDKAYKLAFTAHQGQKRKSGEAYITHPLAVAKILYRWEMDSATLAAALMHDTVEDTAITLDQIKTNFGQEIAFLVEGVTKLGELDISQNKSATSVENLRKLLLSMSEDIRVVSIKLADRLHNLKTLQYLDKTDQIRIANESLDIYAPIADRLGMGRLKAQIEDISFRYANEKEYYTLKKVVAPVIHSYSSQLGAVQQNLEKILAQNNISATVESRVKHLYSIHKKLRRVDNRIEEIRDLVALRIIVDDVDQCYKVLGLVHSIYKPMINLIKDYIAVPKPNGYQSLHTTVLGDNGIIFEVQIRSRKMHQEAEYGLSAHFYYDQSKTSKGYSKGNVGSLPNKLNWVKNLLDWQENLLSSDELRGALKIDLFNSRIFVFSPKGDLFDLPENATPVDFAFCLHTEIGLCTRGAKVNRQIVNLGKPLKNRDVVEILVAKNQPNPSRDWLNFVTTAKARSAIKAWLKNIDRETNQSIGRQMIEQQLIKRSLDKSLIHKPQVTDAIVGRFGLNSFESMSVAVGEGSLSAQRIADAYVAQTKPKKPLIKKIFTKKENYHPNLVGERLSELKLASNCCQPLPRQPIIGFITKSSGVVIHQANCHAIKDQNQRLLPASWQKSDQTDDLKLIITARNRVGLLSDITTEIAKRKLSIAAISRPKRKGDKSYIHLHIENVTSKDEASLISALCAVPQVKSVKRRR